MSRAELTLLKGCVWFGRKEGSTERAGLGGAKNKRDQNLVRLQEARQPIMREKVWRMQGGVGWRGLVMMGRPWPRRCVSRHEEWGEQGSDCTPS